jgi:hypothetical protein
MRSTLRRSQPGCDAREPKPLGHGPFHHILAAMLCSLPDRISDLAPNLLDRLNDASAVAIERLSVSTDRSWVIDGDRRRAAAKRCRVLG